MSNSYNRAGTPDTSWAAQHVPETAMSRRSHPYFGQLNRLEQVRAVTSGGAGGRAPRMTPDEEQGVLWQAFREAEGTA